VKIQCAHGFENSSNPPHPPIAAVENTLACLDRFNSLLRPLQLRIGWSRLQANPAGPD
jgi:hypothetical protein